jgi:hypothetical protein
MDRDFMSDYYDRMYEGTGLLIPQSEEYRQLRKEYGKVEKQLLEKLGGITSDVWKLHERLIMLAYYTSDIVAKDAYLKGAEDRERMLR